jgi:Holliday junction resolvasome RuvABC DNA-binding subunit
VDVHHLRAREAGGNHEPDNLVTLCGAHHRACHRGELLIEKSASGSLKFWHADGTAYGQSPNTGEADVAAQTFRGLRNLGFGEREARDAVRAAGAHVGSEGSVESLLRVALEQLTRNWEKAS